MSAEDFYERMSSKEMRHAYQLSDSMRMISEIAELYDETVDKGQSIPDGLKTPREVVR